MNLVKRMVRFEGDEEVLCPCVALTRTELEDLVASDPEISFDALLARTGAGSHCTACLLDLEHRYSGAAQAPGPRPRAGVAEALFRAPRRPQEGPKAAPGLKQRLYRALDRIAPLSPVPFVNPMPILIGPGIEQSVAVANDRMLYEGDVTGPPMMVGLRVRDGDGNVRHQSRQRVEPGEAMRFDVSHCLEAPAGVPLAVGSVEVSRLFTASGRRGTTRPQVVIEAPGGCCAVHSQGAGLTRRPNWFTCLHRPDEERIFISVVNAGRRPLTGRLDYPFGVAGIEPASHTVTLPPFGAHLHEVVLPEVAARVIDGGPLTLNMMFGGPHKAHVFCASPNLDRFSIDHL